MIREKFFFKFCFLQSEQILIEKFIYEKFDLYNTIWMIVMILFRKDLANKAYF